MPPYAYFHKKFVPLSEAKIGVLTHALHYGTACFDGIRGNWNKEKQELYLFRLKEHYQRLHKGCRILKIDLPYTIDELCRLTVEVVNKSGYQEDVYVRPLAYKSQQAIGVKLHDLEDDFLIVVATLPAYLDTDKGVRCCVSSWRRIDDTMIPARGKITGIYVNSALAKTEANIRGFDEAILLTHDGHVAEGSGENIFLVIDDKLVTPPSSDNILLGITRDTVMKLAKNELGIETEERTVDRTELYTADEAFFTGTAAHVTPIIEVDERQVGDGNIGKFTQKLQELYFDVIRGKNPKYLDWCTPVKARVAKTN
ncbi:MAG: branched-chain amino acid transaminase [Chloroflexi bacterium]|nr:branched-chain amino acid transaminase [Chloroflexota bacterium]MBM3153923.1 branched-chain amino acid transaminase [Chloroflexota bacterium]MBM3172970.1 branched-chain amino acid transaminase [Chloroflexota bacterium]MBM3175277.1 branched-chain amino acid transaminase [Chloroflexota bacterium]MBM4450074.1 branched-chain amino acid transaminase [Chloroflexota bacterium]